MAIKTGAQLKDDLIKNVFASKDSTDDDLITKTFLQESWVYLKVADDAAANTATAITPFGPNALVPSILKSVKMTVNAAVATDPTDFATILVAKRSAAGAATAICSYATSTAAFVAHVPIEFTLPATTAVNLDAGDCLTFQITKGGAGKVVTAGKLVAVVEKARYA
jgi:hypothetical protein